VSKCWKPLGRGVLPESFRWGSVAPTLESVPFFRPKRAIFHTLFRRELKLDAPNYTPDYVHNFDFDLHASSCLPKYQIDIWKRMHDN